MTEIILYILGCGLMFVIIGDDNTLSVLEKILAVFLWPFVSFPVFILLLVKETNKFLKRRGQSR